MRIFHHKMFSKPVGFFENFPMLIVACSLTFMGISGTWISFPLSGEVNLSSLSQEGIYLQIKMLLLTLLVLYCVATAIGFYLARVLVSFALICFVLYLALHYSFFDGENIWRFTGESKAFRDIQHVLALQDTPNAGRSVETALAFDGFRFVDRVKVSVGLLGWGAKLAIICTLLLAVYSIVRSQKVIFSTLLGTLVFGLFYVASGIGDVSLAYLKINQGIRDFSQSTKTQGVSQLNEAALLDPVLNYSVGFPLLRSYGYFVTFGPEDRNAYPYRINQEFVAGEFSSVFALDSYIKNMPSTFAEQTRMGAAEKRQQLAIHRVEHRLVSNAYNRVGLLYLWHQNWAMAEQHFLMASTSTNSLVAKVALLNIYSQTKQYKACNALSEELLDNINNQSISADIWSTKGECLRADGYPTEARLAFQNSIRLDSDKNYRAVKGLSGT